MQQQPCIGKPQVLCCGQQVQQASCEAAPAVSEASWASGEGLRPAAIWRVRCASSARISSSAALLCVRSSSECRSCSLQHPQRLLSRRHLVPPSS